MESKFIFSVLGPLAVTGHHAPHVLGTPKQRVLLGILLLSANQTVSINRLIEALWGDSPPNSAHANIQTYVSAVRRTLEALTVDGGRRLVTRAPGYVLNVHPHDLDLTTFNRLITNGRTALRNGNPVRAVEMFGCAERLWRGRRLLEDISDMSPVLDAQAAAMEEQRLAARNDYIAARLELGEGEELVAELREMTHLWPLDERTWYHLMLALYQSGMRAAALEVYQQARQTMVNEIGIDPSDYLRTLHETILAGRLDKEMVGAWRSGHG